MPNKASKKSSNATSNSKIINEQTYQPSTEDNFNYVPVMSLNIYEFMDDAYQGTRGFQDGSYLIPHSRELFYDARRDLAFYKNFLKPILRAMIDPVFNHELNRAIKRGEVVVTEGMLVNEFIDNADNSGNSLHDFMKITLKNARLHGVTFVIVDNFTEQPDTTMQALQDRKLPYVHLRKAYSVDKWESDAFGNLIWIQFTEGRAKKKKDVNLGGGKEVTKLTKYDRKNITKIERDVMGNEVIVETIVHGLNKIPVIPVYTTDRESLKNVKVFPPLYDIAKINHAIFNKDSEIRDQERAQGFSVFYIPSDMAGDTAIGTHNVLWVPTDSPFAPGFASPDSSILTGLMENSKMLREDLFRIAGQNGVVGIEAKASGIAKQWDFIAQETVLKDTSMIATATEEKILDLFKAYTGEDFDYIVDYPVDFDPLEEETQLAVIDKVLLMGMPPTASAMLKKKAFKLVTKNDDEVEQATALEAFDAEMESSSSMASDGEDTEGEVVGQLSEDDIKNLLNGAQVTSLVNVIKEVAAGNINVEIGRQILIKAFAMSEQEARTMIPDNIKAVVKPVEEKPLPESNLNA